MSSKTAYLFIRPRLAAKAPGTALRRLRDLIYSAMAPDMSADDQQTRAVKPTTPRGPLGMGPGVRSFGVISADRHEYSPQERAEARERLRQMLATLGLGYIKQTGVWHELIQGSHGPAHVKVPVNELSFVLFGPTMANMRRLCTAMHQDAIIYCGPETGGTVQVIGDNWADNLGDFKVLDQMDTGTMDHLHENRSTLKNHTYTFASYPALCRPRR